MVRLFQALLLLLVCMPALIYADNSPQHRVQVSSTDVWERQQVTVVAQVITPDRFATLVIDTPRIEGFEIYTIPHTRVQNPDGNHVLRTGWILFPLLYGQHTVSLPAVNYRLGGAIEYTFNTPEINIQVKALPPYIPPTIPVGRVSIQSRIQPDGLLTTDHLSYWHITLRATSVPPVWMPPVLRHIKSSPDVKFLSASSERTITPDVHGIQGQVVHHVPLKALSNGQLTLPEIQFQYFDPDSGRIETVKHKPVDVISLSTTLRIVLAGFCIFVLFSLLRVVYRNYKIWSDRRRAITYALGLIKQAQNADDLRYALRRYAAAEGWSDNIDLSRWLYNCEQNYHFESPLSQVIHSLSCVSYGRESKSAIGDIRDSLINALETAKIKKYPEMISNKDHWSPETLTPKR